MKEANAWQRPSYLPVGTLVGHPDPDQRLPLAQLKNHHDHQEDGDAELLARKYHKDLKYDPAEKKWYRWDIHYWIAIDDEILTNYVTTGLYEEYQAGASSPGEPYPCFIQRCYKLKQLPYIRKVLDLAKGKEALRIEHSKWNRAPGLLPCHNGVIDLKTGQLSPGEPEQYFNVSIPLDWQGLDAKCPQWEKFLVQIFGGDREIVAFIQPLCGYALTGQSSEHILLMFIGEGSNGKDVFMGTINFVLGHSLTYVAPAEMVLAKSFAGGENASPFTVQMKDKRIVWMNECDGRQSFNQASLKNLTGGGSITGRPLYGASVTYEPSHLMILVGNHAPQFTVDDPAIWNRLIIIPFPERFTENPEGPHEHPIDKNMKKKLEEEAPGILAWMVRGSIEYYKMGLQIPKQIMANKQQLLRDLDDVGQFIDQCCRKSPGAKTPFKELYQGYQGWCEDNGTQPISKQAFSKSLVRKGYKREEARHPCFWGIEIPSSQEMNEADI